MCCGQLLMLCTTTSAHACLLLTTYTLVLGPKPLQRACSCSSWRCAVMRLPASDTSLRVRSTALPPASPAAPPGCAFSFAGGARAPAPQRLLLSKLAGRLARRAARLRVLLCGRRARSSLGVHHCHALALIPCLQKLAIAKLQRHIGLNLPLVLFRGCLIK